MSDEKKRLIAVSTENVEVNNLLDYIHEVEFAGADYLHCDVMDGIVVDNFTFDHKVVKAIAKKTKLPLDVHLIMDDTRKYVRKYTSIRPRPAIITVQYDLFYYERQLRKTLKIIRRYGVKAGLALSPNIPVSYILPFFNLCDVVVVLGTEIGEKDTVLDESTLLKIGQLMDLKKRYKKDLIIEFGGGVNKENSSRIFDAGVDIIVSGRYVQESFSKKYAVQKLREKADLTNTDLTKLKNVLPKKKERLIKINY